MPVESLTQMTLANSLTFRLRLMYMLCQQARIVKAEALNTQGHVQRSTYADTVLANPGAAAANAAVTIVGGVNLIGTVVPNLDPMLIDSNAADAAIFSQIGTFWSALARVDTGA